MSTDYITYFGSYAQCKFEPIILPSRRTCCPNVLCIKYGANAYNKFCNECGSKIEATNFPVEGSSVDLDELHRCSLKEKLTNPQGDYHYKYMEDNKVHIWMPNIKLNKNFKFYFIKESLTLDVGVDLINEAIQEFEFIFDKEIKILKEKYINVTIKYGLLHCIW